MHRGLIVICLAGSGCLLTWSPCQPDEGSIVAGGGFDSLQCWRDPADTWRGDVTLDEASGTLGDEPALRVENAFTAAEVDDIRLMQAGGDALMRDTLFVEEGREVTVRIQDRASAEGRPFRITVQDFVTGEVQAQANLTASTGWQQHTLFFTQPRDVDLELILGVGGPDDATLWLDDVRIEVVEVEGD